MTRKRLLAVLLTLCLLLQAAPVLAAEESANSLDVIFNADSQTATIGGTEYSLRLWQGVQQYNGSLGFWGMHVNRGFICGENEDPSQIANTFRYYLFLLDSSNMDAPKEVYEAFWNSGITMEATLDETELIIDTASDGYHKYVTATVYGECSGYITLTVSSGDVSTMFYGNFTFTKATKLELEWNENVGSATIANASGGFYYVDISDEPVSVTVSGELTGENAMGSVSLGQMQEGEDETFLWRRWAEGEPMVFNPTISASKLLLRVDPTSENTDCAITVATAAKQMMYKSMMYDPSSGGWSENPNMPIQPISNFQLQLGTGQSHIRLYWGTADNAEPLSGSALTSSNPNVVTVSGTNDPDCVFEARSLGTATLTYGEHTFDFTVSLPYTGFYSARVRDGAHLLSGSVNWGNLEDGVVWVLKEQGFTANEKDGVTINAQNVSIPNENLTWVQREGQDVYDLKLTLPEPAQNSFYSFYIGKTGWWGTNWLRVDAPAIPQLMYKYTRFDQATNSWVVNEQGGIWSLASLQASINNSLNVCLYYGTPDNAVALSGSTLKSSNANIIATYGNNNPYCTLEIKGIGTTTLSYGEYSCNVTVSLPYIGFYSARSRDAAHIIGTVYGYSDLTDHAVWFMSEAGFDESAKNSISVTFGNGAAKAEELEWVKREGQNTYDLKITVPNPAISGSGGYALGVIVPGIGGTSTMISPAAGKAEYIDGHVIGLATEQAGGDVTIMYEGKLLIAQGTSANTQDTHAKFTVKASAATKSMEGQRFIYLEDDRVCDSLKVKRWWIQPVSGDEGAFSFSKDAYITSIDSPNGRYIDIYIKHGIVSTVLLCAEVEGTINNEPFTATVSEPAYTMWNDLNSTKRPNNDTVEELNKYLEELAKEIVDDRVENSINKLIYLGNTTYEGTIVVPSAFNGPNMVSFLGAENTVLKGSINLAGHVSAITNIHFIASEKEAVDGITKGVYGYGNGVRLAYCSFRGYDIAVDASEGIISVETGNVLADNEIGVLVDVNGTPNWAYPRTWSNNAFVKNGTAVKVLSTNDLLTPYYFRIYDSNFIGNEIDFDIRCEGKFYMYRNFFGKIHPQAEDMDTGEYLIALSKVQDKNDFNQLANSNPPRIELDKKISEVITNPRQKRPVSGWWQSSADIEDIFGSTASAMLLSESDEDVPENELVVDWELKTDIINEEADQLVIDPSAFEEEGEKKITVVEGESGELGFWTFD